MTQLRDARLRKAMEQAPDAQAQPLTTTRAAIRAAAHGALRPWWWRRPRSGGSARMPWNAAFATLLLGGVVALLWQDRDVAAPQQAPQDTATVQTAPAPEDATAAGAARQAAPAPVGPLAPEAASDQQAAATAAVPLQLESSAPAAAPAAPLPQQERSARAVAPPADVAPAGRASSAPATRPAAAPPPVAARALQGPTAGTPLAPAPTGWQHWSQVRVESGGRSVVVPRGQSASLPLLIERMLRRAGQPAPATTAAQLRFELAQGDHALGALELADGQWRWLPLSDVQRARALVPDPQAAAALQVQAEQLLKE